MDEAIADVSADRTGAGSRALSLFTYSANVAVLRAHEERPQRLCELVETHGWIAESSLRTAVRRLCAVGALARNCVRGGRRAQTELTPAGRELLSLAEEVERWLRDAPNGPVMLEDPVGRSIVRAVSASWDAGVVRFCGRAPDERCRNRC